MGTPSFMDRGGTPELGRFPRRDVTSHRAAATTRVLDDPNKEARSCHYRITTSPPHHDKEARNWGRHHAKTSWASGPSTSMPWIHRMMVIPGLPSRSSSLAAPEAAGREEGERGMRRDRERLGFEPTAGFSRKFPRGFT